MLDMMNENVLMIGKDRVLVDELFVWTKEEERWRPLENGKM